MDFFINLDEGVQFAIQIVVVLVCLFYGARKGGVALGMLGGIGILMLVFLGNTLIDVVNSVLSKLIGQ